MKRFFLTVLILPLLIQAYNIKPGDKLKVFVPGIEFFDQLFFEVEKDGTIILPYIGSVEIVNKTLAEASLDIKEKYSHILNSPDVIIAVAEKAPVIISIISNGDMIPKSLMLPEGSNIMEAVSAAQIDLSRICQSRVKILKKDGRIVKINLAKVIKKNDPALTATTILEQGDVLYIPDKPKLITLDNLVKFLSLVSSTIVILKYIEGS